MAVPEAEDLYEILQVQPTAHPDVIRAAYRRLALLYHPDKNPSQEAAEIMRRLNLAYETLGDPARRATYDRARDTRRSQRTETRSGETASGRSRTAGATSQSRTVYPTKPLETRRGRVLTMIVGSLFLVVVGIFVVLGISGDDGRSGGVDASSRSVIVSPTQTPFLLRNTPAPVPTTIPASGVTKCVAPAAPIARPVTSHPPDLATMVEQVKPGVVRIWTRSGSGTGIIFEATTQGCALILTNYHVIQDSERIDVQVNDSDAYGGRVVGYEEVQDLAVLEICCGEFQQLHFNDSEDIRPGTEVVAIGYALGLTGSATVTRGIVSAVRYDDEYNAWVLQTDAPINPGNSGGPLLSTLGQVLGINTFGIDRSESGIPTDGLGFAVSAKTVQEILPELTQQGRLAAAPALPPKNTPTPIIRLTATPALAPTLAPKNTPTPTPMPIATHTPVPTPTLQPSPTPEPQPTVGSSPPPTLSPTATPTRRPTATLSPTPAPSPTLVPTVTPQQPLRGEYFTRGSSQDDVLHAQGTPTGIDRYEASRREIWSYGYSRITFSLPDGRVTEWNNSDGNLKVRLYPKAGELTAVEHLTRGSSQDDVLHAQGTPTGIDRYEASRREIWSYGYSRITFSLPDGRVTEWNNSDGNLKVRLYPKAGELTAVEHFTRGSSQDEVVQVQGTPTGIDRYEASRREIWSYGYSRITFSLPDGRVTEWNNSDGNLKVRLYPKAGELTAVEHFTRGSSQDEVVQVQGTPTGIDRYEASRREIWSYGYSRITFSLPDGRVTEWNNSDGNLKVRLYPKAGELTAVEHFTRGSSQDEVVQVQGTPTGIDRYEASRREIWSYGYSRITFSLPDGRVTEWNNIDGNLKVR